MNFWTCPREWPGETVFIIASGPSVLAEDIPALQSRRVIVINSSAFIAPFADFLVFGDSRWFFNLRPRIETFKGRMVTTSSVPMGPRILHMRKIKPPPGFTTMTDALVMERTTLQAAINLALHLGSDKIIVIGADMKPGADGRSHHHPPHPWPVRPDNYSTAMDQLRLIGKGAKRMGVEIVNTSMDSAIDFWPKHPLKDLLT